MASNLKRRRVISATKNESNPPASVQEERWYADVLQGLVFKRQHVPMTSLPCQPGIA